MKFKLNKKKIIIAGVNAASLVGFLVFSLVGSSQAGAQKYNYAAERWSDDGYAQISCFFPENSSFTVDSLGGIRAEVINQLQAVSIAPEENQKLCPDAYSADAGQATLRGTMRGRSEAQLTAVGGDFFLIHDFKLVDGAYFSDDDLMQDGAVIDRNLAWALFGSDKASGMTMTINDVRFYVAGVIEAPDTKDEKYCAGELPRAYISYDGASGFATSGFAASDSPDIKGMEGEASMPPESSAKFNAVTCYEIIMPDPVENYAYNALKDTVKNNGGKAVQNNGRFDPVSRVKALRHFSRNAVKSDEISYPFWENASRMTEMRLTFIYTWAAVCLVIPALTVLWGIVRCAKALKRNRKKIFKAIGNTIKKIFKKK